MSDNKQLGARHYEEDLWEFESRQRMSQRYQQIFQIYAVFGALLGAISLAYFFFRRIQISLSPEDRLILLAAGSGFALSFASAIYLFLRKQNSEAKLRRVRYMTSASDFLAQWARFEETGRKRLEAVGTTFNKTSIRDIVAGLVEAGVLKKADLPFIEEALRFRNFLVHSGSSVDLESIHHMTGAIRELVDRVEAEAFG